MNFARSLISGLPIWQHGWTYRGCLRSPWATSANLLRFEEGHLQEWHLKRVDICKNAHTPEPDDDFYPGEPSEVKIIAKRLQSVPWH